MADKELVPIPKGSLITVTSGMYSDYTIDGIFKAVELLDPKQLLEEWLILHPEEREYYGFNDYKFIAWLHIRNLIEPVECYEWHLEDYSNPEEEMQSYKLEGNYG